MPTLRGGSTAFGDLDSAGRVLSGSRFCPLTLVDDGGRRPAEAPDSAPQITDALDLVERHRIGGPVVELRRLRRRVPGDPLRALERLLDPVVRHPREAEHHHAQERPIPQPNQRPRVGSGRGARASRPASGPPSRPSSQRASGLGTEVAGVRPDVGRDVGRRYRPQRDPTEMSTTPGTAPLPDRTPPASPVGDHRRELQEPLDGHGPRRVDDSPRAARPRPRRETRPLPGRPATPAPTLIPTSPRFPTSFSKCS